MFRPSRFSELLKSIRRDSFEKSVERHQANKFSKGFGCWQHLVAMLYAQLSGFGSLRDVETGFNEHVNHHYHLGARPIKRATLADANRTRSLMPFLELTQSLISQVGRTVARDIREGVYLLDATPITLKGRGFEWTVGTKTRKGQGLKVHMELASEVVLPTYLKITPPNINDITVGQEMPLREGVIYVFDKGYCDYNWWWKIHCAHSKFVTRLKSNAAVELRAQRDLSEEPEDILEDVEFVLKNRQPRGGKYNDYCEPLRRVTVRRKDQRDKVFVLVTNDMESSAVEIADLYRQRWQIELFFKWIKQNLKIKKFLGRSDNAVKIQILTAIIAYLLTAAFQRRSEEESSLRQIMVAIKSTLFARTAMERDRTLRKREFDSQQLGLSLCH